MVLGYFSALPYSLDIEPLDAKGAATSIFNKWLRTSKVYVY